MNYIHLSDFLSLKLLFRFHRNFQGYPCFQVLRVHNNFTVLSKPTHIHTVTFVKVLHQLWIVTDLHRPQRAPGHFPNSRVLRILWMNVHNLQPTRCRLLPRKATSFPRNDTECVRWRERWWGRSTTYPTHYHMLPDQATRESTTIAGWKQTEMNRAGLPGPARASTFSRNSAQTPLRSGPLVGTTTFGPLGRLVWRTGVNDLPRPGLRPPGATTATTPGGIGQGQRKFVLEHWKSFSRAVVVEENEAGVNAVYLMSALFTYQYEICCIYVATMYQTDGNNTEWSHISPKARR